MSKTINKVSQKFKGKVNKGYQGKEEYRKRYSYNEASYTRFKFGLWKCI